MKDYVVLTYPAYEYHLDELLDLYKWLEKELSPRTKVLLIPDLLTLKEYDKDELLDLLNIYTNTMEKLINEQTL